MVEGLEDVKAKRLYLIPAAIFAVLLWPLLSHSSSAAPSESAVHLTQQEPEQQQQQPEEPRPYIPRQPSLASLAQLDIPCYKWLVNGTEFDGAELAPATSLPSYSPGQEPSRCDWPGQPFNKSDFTGFKHTNSSIMVRYKLYKGALYRDMHMELLTEHSQEFVDKAYEEQILLALHVYRALLPDMDFLVDYGDAPFIGYGIPVLGQCIWKDPGRESGCARPDPVVWQRLSASRAQLQQYFQCSDSKYPVEAKVPKVGWRGAGSHGLMQRLHPGHPQPQDWKHRLMLSPRLKAAVMSMNLDYMDVGVTQMHFPDFNGGKDPPVEEQALVEELFRVEKPGIETEGSQQWAGMLTVAGGSLAGWLDHIPTQLLFGSVNLMHTRNVDEWFEHRLEHGVHVLKFRADLADMLVQSAEVAEGYATGNISRWEDMIAHMRGLALEMFSTRGVVDAVAWGLVEYNKRYAPYKIDRPMDGPLTFEPVVHKKWVNPFLPPSVRRHIELTNPINFELSEES